MAHNHQTRSTERFSVTDLNALMPDQSPPLTIDLGQCGWIRSHAFGVEVIRSLPLSISNSTGSSRAALLAPLAAPSPPERAHTAALSPVIDSECHAY